MTAKIIAISVLALATIAAVIYVSKTMTGSFVTVLGLLVFQFIVTLVISSVSSGDSDDDDDGDYNITE